MNINLNITPNTVLHPVKTNVSKMTERVTLAGSSKNTAADKPVGRFDTFTLVGSDGSEKVRKLSAEKAELVRNLDNLSEEEKAEIAVGSYIYMQRSCKEALDRHEIDMYSFQSLQEEKAYYNELKNQDGVISEENGKYCFSTLISGSVISKKEIDAALSDVQERINSYIMAPTEETARYELSDKIFRSEARAFSEATNISDDALNLDDDSFCRFREGLTEENYLEKTGEAIDSIKNRSRQLRNVMSDYVGGNPYAKELMMNLDKLFNKTENTDKTPLAEILEQYREQLELTDMPKSELLSDNKQED